MKKMKKSLVLALAAVMVVNLTACKSSSKGSDSVSSSNTSSGSNSVTDNSSSTGSTTTSSDVSEETRKIVVGVTSDCIPCTYVDENGDIVGYDVDLIKAADELLPQYEFSFEAVDQTAMLAGLQTNKYQVGTAGLMATSDREETFDKVDFAFNYYYVVLAVPEDSTINTFEDCVGKKLTPIAPNNGLYSTLISWEDANEKLDYDVVDVYGYNEGFTSVMDGTYDAYLTNADAFDIFKGLIEGFNLKMSDPVATVGAYMFTNKEETEVNAALAGALAQLKENGTMAELSKKWYNGEDVSSRNVK